MHRGSARYLPLAPTTHHWFDSTHITYGVVTAGVAGPRLQLEASAFRGREPDERRWNVETPRLDSWSVRATWTPTAHLAAQVSHGRLESPEAQHQSEDERRTTASIHHARGGLTTTLAWSLKDRVGGRALPAWLGEANWEVGRHHGLFGRVEIVENDELHPDLPIRATTGRFASPRPRPAMPSACGSPRLGAWRWAARWRATPSRQRSTPPMAAIR